MAFTNLETKQIHCKVLYVGAEGAGVTTNLQSIREQTKYSENKGYLSKEDENNPLFEFLPLSLGKLGGFDLRLHLYALSVSKMYRSCLPVLLRGVDALVYVVDSRLSKLLASLQSVEAVHSLFNELGEDLSSLPSVVQFNWRDHPEAVPMELLRSEFNPTLNADVEASAKSSIGTMETVETISRLLVDRLSEQHGG